jgi:hypothetical protein
MSHVDRVMFTAKPTGTGGSTALKSHRHAMLGSLLCALPYNCSGWEATS